MNTTEFYKINFGCSHTITTIGFLSTFDSFWSLSFSQVAIIYCGVRGHLDKLDPTKITAFEKEFTAHIKTSHQSLLASIAKDGQITPETDAALKKLVTEFVATFTAQ